MSRLPLVAALAASAALAAPAAAAPPPDRLTAVVASVIAPPQQVLASDGRRHLAYELDLSNRAPATVTIRRIDVLAGGHVVGSLRGARLAAVMRPSGEQRTGAKLHGGQSGYVMMDVSFARRARLPHRLVHRFTVRMKPRDPTAATTYRTAPTRVVRRPAVVVAPPLRGPGWVVGNGCCAQLDAHRAAVLPVNGALHVAERFAIDFVQMDPAGLLFTGPLDALTGYRYYGAPVHSATAGKVVGVVDGMAENAPGSFPPGITAAKAGGNHVVVAMGHGRYAFYAHLQPGSIAVRVGDRVRTGEVIGRLGNTGNSDAPHLHFHVMDGPSPLSSDGLPYRFTRFRVQGAVTNFDAFQAGAKATLAPVRNGVHRRELPLNLEVLDFGP